MACSESPETRCLKRTDNSVKVNLNQTLVSSLIRDRSIHEAKRLLAYTALTVAEVGYELGYLDPAYFTRVFRMATGQTPKAFRARVQS